jgi:ABC-type uncharacterized transport system involved in gliding motility auxiliary subunit
LPSQGNRAEVIPYLQYMALTKDHKNFNSSDAITSQLEKVHLDIAGILNLKPGATVKLEPLLQTGPDAQAMDTKVVQMMPDAKKLLQDFQAGKSAGTPFALAARITGKVKTAFPNGDPAKPAPAEGQPAPADTSLKESSQDASIIIVADCDMLADRLWVQEARLGQMLLGYSKFADNGDFVFGAVDNLTGSKDLMSLRARGKYQRPFDRVEKIQKTAEDKYLQKQKELQDALAAKQKQIDDLQQKAPQGGGVVLTPEQQAVIKAAREDMVATRRQLRDVQHQLRKDIDSLGTSLAFINIGLMPLAVGILAVGLSLYRVNRRRSVKVTSRT